MKLSELVKEHGDGAYVAPNGELLRVEGDMAYFASCDHTSAHVGNVCCDDWQRLEPIASVDYHPLRELSPSVQAGDVLRTEAGIVLRILAGSTVTPLRYTALDADGNIVAKNTSLSDFYMGTPVRRIWPVSEPAAVALGPKVPWIEVSADTAAEWILNAPLVDLSICMREVRRRGIIMSLESANIPDPPAVALAEKVRAIISRRDTYKDLEQYWDQQTAEIAALLEKGE